MSTELNTGIIGRLYEIQREMPSRGDCFILTLDTAIRIFGNKDYNIFGGLVAITDCRSLLSLDSHLGHTYLQQLLPSKRLERAWRTIYLRSQPDLISLLRRNTVSVLSPRIADIRFRSDLRPDLSELDATHTFGTYFDATSNRLIIWDFLIGPTGEHGVKIFPLEDAIRLITFPIKLYQYDIDLLIYALKDYRDSEILQLKNRIANHAILKSKMFVENLRDNISLSHDITPKDLYTIGLRLMQINKLRAHALSDSGLWRMHIRRQIMEISSQGSLRLLKIVATSDSWRDGDRAAKTAAIEAILMALNLETLILDTIGEEFR